MAPPVVFAAAAFGVVLALGYVAQVIVLDNTASAAISASVAGARAPLRPDDIIQVTARGAGVQLAGVQLFRTDDSRADEQVVPVHLQSIAEADSWQLVADDGTPVLRSDGAYRLAVRITAPRPSLPLPRTAMVERQYRFSTVASPHAMRCQGANPDGSHYEHPRRALGNAVLG